MGPWTDRGFFYDFAWPADSPLTEKDLKKIKKEMAKIMKANLPFVKEEVRAAGRAHGICGVWTEGVCGMNWVR